MTGRGGGGGGRGGRGGRGQGWGGGKGVSTTNNISHYNYVVSSFLPLHLPPSLPPSLPLILCTRGPAKGDTSRKDNLILSLQRERLCPRCFPSPADTKKRTKEREREIERGTRWERGKEKEISRDIYKCLPSLNVLRVCGTRVIIQYKFARLIMKDTVTTWSGSCWL